MLLSGESPSKAEVLTNIDTAMERDPEVSPDGRFLAFESFDPQSNAWNPVVTNLETGERVLQIAETSYGEMEWLPDGSGLAMARSEAGTANVWSYALDDSEPEQLTIFDDDKEIRFFVWLPDSNNLILSRGTRSNDVVLITDFH